VAEDCFYKLKNSPYRRISSSSQSSKDTIYRAREYLAQILDIDDPNLISFTHNATHGLNIAIKGILKPNDHVIITNLEHNSGIRPILKLNKHKGISYSVLETDELGQFNLIELETLINDNTRLIILNHASNVIGTISPIMKIGKIAKKHKILLMVDCTQTAGLIDISVKECEIDILVGTAHKCLLGPSGVGFLHARNYELIDTLYEGGSGYDSIAHSHPKHMPLKFEAGTINYLGIAGFEKSLEFFVKNKQEIQERKDYIKEVLYTLINNIPQLVIYGSNNHISKIPILSFNIPGFLPNQVEYILDKEWNIIVRAGLHCAPLIHKTLKTLPTGTVRVSPGFFNTKNDILALVRALESITSGFVA